MMNQELLQVVEHWPYVASVASYPKSNKQYHSMVNKLYELLDVVGEDKDHPLMDLVDIISHFVEEYEREHYKKKQRQITGIDALRFLMESHHLTQSDLPEIGSQGVISEILSGKRSLNLRQVEFLCKRFSVDPSTFITGQ